MQWFGAPKQPQHACMDSYTPIKAVPIPGMHEGREVMKTAVLFKCKICSNFLELVFNGLYAPGDLEIGL